MRIAIRILFCIVLLTSLLSIASAQAAFTATCAYIDCDHTRPVRPNEPVDVWAVLTGPSILVSYSPLAEGKPHGKNLPAG